MKVAIVTAFYVNWFFVTISIFHSVKFKTIYFSNYLFGLFYCAYIQWPDVKFSLSFDSPFFSVNMWQCLGVSSAQLAFASLFNEDILEKLQKS